MNRPRRDHWLTGVSIALLAVWMSLPGHHRGGVLVGALLCACAVLGVLGLLGDSPLDLRGDEHEPAPESGPWWRSMSARVALFGAVLYVPLAGAYGLWDPWETHYSEVAREMLTRDDWITTWWAQEGWFLSKPVLVFWMSALGMGVGSLFGVPYAADAGVGAQEWCIRLPIVMLTIAAMVALARAVARSWGPRAGLLVAMVLGTMPHWFFLSHQAMTDMPFVAPLVIAVSMLMMALTDDPEALSRPRIVTVFGRKLRISLWHLTVAFVMGVALPQIIYLLTRKVAFSCPEDANLAQCAPLLARSRVLGIQFPIEIFYSGSAGNSGVNGLASVPGSPQWERLAGAVPFFPSFVQGITWASVLYSVLLTLKRDRREKTLHYALFYAWCGVSTMGKGPAGLAIPGAVALLHLVSTARWRELYELRVGLGVATFLVTGMPWYIAITGRLGSEFYDRFVRHDLINRFAVGVHGDTGSLRYFLWQLGYSMFPWSGLVPMALLGWRYVVPSDSTPAQRDVARIGMLWFAMVFTLFSGMTTKFHHYIFPAIPGAAVLVGLLLHRLMGEERPRASAGVFADLRPQLAQAGAIIIGVCGAARFVGNVQGTVPADGVIRANPVLGAGLVAVAAGVWWFGSRLQRDDDAAGEVLAKNYRENQSEGDASAPPVAPPSVEERSFAAAVGALALGAVSITALIARDLASTRGTPPGSERLIHLFVYNYDRAWPARFLDYRGVLFGFGLIAALSIGLLCVSSVRRYAARGVVLVAAVFAVWGLDVYMIELTPHWSQRALFQRYYAERRPTTRDRRFTHDPIVAHQMNWKGENFYTGNHVVAEECGLKYCIGSTAEFLRAYGAGRVFFVAEHSRVQALLGVIRTANGEGRALTTERENNKFALVLGVMRGSAAAPGAATPSATAPNAGAPSAVAPSVAPRWNPTEVK